MSAPGSSLVLASTSPTRRAMLLAAGAAFTVEAPGVDETALKAGLATEEAPARDVAMVLAEAKATRVARRRPGLVLGGDSTLECDGRLYDKPDSLAEARAHLASLRGRTAKLHAAAVIAEGPAPVWRVVTTATLVFRDFSDAFLDDYLAVESEAVLGSVGAFRLEGLGAQLFNRVEGDYFTVLGLPLLEVLAYLRERGVLAR